MEPWTGPIPSLKSMESQPKNPRNPGLKPTRSQPKNPQNTGMRGWEIPSRFPNLGMLHRRENSQIFGSSMTGPLCIHALPVSQRIPEFHRTPESHGIPESHRAKRPLRALPLGHEGKLGMAGEPGRREKKWEKKNQGMGLNFPPFPTQNLQD